MIVGVAGPTKLDNLTKMASSLGIGPSTALLYSQPGRDCVFGLGLGVGGWNLRVFCEFFFWVGADDGTALLACAQYSSRG